MAFTNQISWYVAELIEEAIVEGDPRNVIHINTVLVRASCSEQAYEKALELGRSCENEYENTTGKKVRWRFRGLRDLREMLEPPEHGAEVIWKKKSAFQRAK